MCLETRNKHTITINKTTNLILVGSVEVRGFSVERIIRVGLVEQVNHSVDHRVDVQHWLPFFAQNIQAHVSFQVDIRVVYFSAACDFRGFVGIQSGDGDGEHVLGSRPEARVRRNSDSEIGEVIGIRKIDLRNGSTIQLGNIY